MVNSYGTSPPIGGPSQHRCRCSEDLELQSLEEELKALDAEDLMGDLDKFYQ